MADSTDSRSRFSGLADGYDRYRPDYPAAAFDFLIHRCRLQPDMPVADVGCGTGISTRMLAARGFRAIGIEPNADMLRRANHHPDKGNSKYRAGAADATGLDDESVVLVLAAQAFHWFANESALSEFRRILKPGGFVALMWNEQDRDDPFTAVHVQALIETSPEPAIASWRQSETGAALLQSPLFSHAERFEFPHRQTLDRVGLLGRAYSASFAPKAAEPRQRLESTLLSAFDRFHVEGRVVLRYRTVVYLAQKTTT